MLVDIDKIIVKDRIRKDFGNIEELANDIKENTLLNPITVIPIENGMYQLIAGERRLRACKHLGYKQIVVNSVSVRDAEQALRMEIAENENRKEFTFSERMGYARRLEIVERAKAKENLRLAGEGFQISEKVNSNKTVAEKSGFGSHDTYNKAKFIAENADEETIKALDEKAISINAAYQKIMQQLKEERQYNEELQQTLRDKDRQIRELKIKPVEVKTVVPDDYEQIKNEMRQLADQNKTLLEQKQQLARQLQESRALQTEIINFDEFRQNIGYFLDKMAKYTFYSEAFALLEKRQQTEFLKQVEKIDIWCTETKQAIRGEKSDKTIIFEGGFRDVE